MKTNQPPMIDRILEAVFKAGLVFLFGAFSMVMLFSQAPTYG